MVKFLAKKGLNKKFEFLAPKPLCVLDLSVNLDSFPDFP